MEIGGKDTMKTRILTLPDAPQIREMYPDKSIVLVGGCFDVIHLGHIRFFQHARAAGDVLAVALESDEFIRTRKHREPVHGQLERAEILTAFRMVDVVVLLPLMHADTDYVQMVNAIHPMVIGVTEGDPFLRQKQEQATKIGATVQEVSPLLPNYSTTKIISYANIPGDRNTG